MSRKTDQKVRDATRKAGGATLTKVARSAGLNMFFNVMKKELNIQVHTFEKLKTSQVKAYVDYLKRKGLKDRSIQNQMSHLRQALCAVNRHHFASSEPMSNKAFGVSGASRDGTHQALTELQYRAALAATKADKPGAAACMQLQRELGLRAREAIQSCESLKSWEKALTASVPCQVLRGTKGGRGRWTGPVDVSRALAAVRDAIAVAKAQGGYLIVSKNLESAARAYGRACEKVGMKGEHASHALRCMFAQDRYAMHLQRLGSRTEALAATSLDLGHGDGRGTYVAQVYLRNAPH
jgi:site-specific recombinase XerC